MKVNIILLFLAIGAHQIADAIVVDTDLKAMQGEVKANVELVTSEAANENPNTLTDQRELGDILNKHVKLFDEAYENDLKTLQNTIETARQNAGIGSAKALCYKLELTKIDPLRENGVQRAKVINEKVDQQVEQLVESTRILIDQTKLDLDVKTIVQLCMKIYTGIGQDKERLKCFDEYGAHLSIGQKSKGESLLERVGTIQLQSLRISEKTDVDLRGMFAANQLDWTSLNNTQTKCQKLPNTRRLF
ncbi:uncharacterized protein LOC123292424 [Chrysoperla carnea]|uniref:uncharacterized protein LOC123292424 n=1 Tax=Chrysoperla carnea TaxID=189513 RepID=UPI001D078C48|nr:uncharacterized protein LOC123292424 [Chrysoperla carnea]